MPTAIIKKASEQTGRSVKKLESMWKKIESSVNKNPKYKGYAKDKKYAIIMGAFVKSSGYTPATESVVVNVVPLRDLDEDDVIAMARSKDGRGLIIIELPMEGVSERFLLFKTSKAVEIDEDYAFGNLYSVYDDFRSISGCISDVTRKIMSKLPKDAFAGNYAKYDEKYEEVRSKVKDKIIESFKIPGNEGSNRVFQLSEDEFDDIKCLEDPTGFHALWSPQMETTTDFFHCLYAIDKDAAIKLVREGTLFSVHRYFSDKSFGA